MYLYAYVVSLRVCLFSHTSWHALCLRAVAHSAVAHSRRGLCAVAHTRRRARGQAGRVCVSAQTASGRVCLVCVGAQFRRQRSRLRKVRIAMWLMRTGECAIAHKAKKARYFSLPRAAWRDCSLAHGTPCGMHVCLYADLRAALCALTHIRRRCRPASGL